jgi:hypothetical protein
MPVANLLSVPLLRMRVFQVTSCVLLSVRVYLSCWAWSDFPKGGGAPGLSCLAAFMSTHPARHVCTRRPRLACVSSCALQSAQLIPLHHYAHLHYVLEIAGSNILQGFCTRFTLHARAVTCSKP